MSTRRSFLFAVGAGAPLILGAIDKAGTRKPVLGSGDHVYEVTHDWGDLPVEIKYGNTHGVCEDSNGHIYIHHTVNAASESSDSMVVFDHKGKFVKSWGKDFKGVVSRRRESVVLYEEMEVGPLEPPYRRRLQTARSCFSQKL